MKFISLFAGFGGADLGLERAGMQCVAQIEKDIHCQQVLTSIWPHVPKYGDIKHVNGKQLPPADLIVGGFPCQPFSLAGKRRGAEDDRYLWPEYFRLIKEIRPRWVIGENVPGIINTELDTVLSDLEGEDYTTGTLNLPACAFDAWHIRYRIFIVAYAESERRREEGKDRPDKQAERIAGRSSNVAYSDSDYSDRRSINEQMGGEWFKSSIEEDHLTKGIQWTTEPELGRVAYGIPNRVERLRGLGNAIVPVVMEFIGRNIMQVEAMLKEGRA